MKKSGTIWTFVLFGMMLFAAHTSAANEIKVWVDQQLLQSDEAPPRMENEKVIVPVRELAEMLGATVKWNGETNSVEITSSGQDSLLQQVRLLQSALTAKTPEQAVEMWAEGVKTRNGALQYAILSKHLKELRHESFEAVNWVTGTSSPWLERYKISKPVENSDGSRTFRVQFDYRTEMDADEPERWDKIASFPVIVREENGSWFISSFPSEWAQQAAVLPNGLPFTEYVGDHEGEHIRLQFQRLGVSASGSSVKEAVGNHSEIVLEEKLDLPIGTVTFAEVKRTRPAAEQTDAAEYEYWLILLRDDPERADAKRAYCLMGTVTGDKEKAKKEMLDIAATWKLIEE